MKEKGFTLIELLAVIVILAIIALIATPIILNIINDSRKGAFLATANNVEEALKIYYAEEAINDNEFIKKTFDLSENIDDLNIDGEPPAGGTITINKEGKVALAVYDESKTWCAIKKENDSKITVIDYNEDTCDYVEYTDESCFKTAVYGTLYITEYDNNCPKDVVIPKKINGIEVKNIGAPFDSSLQKFSGRQLTSVVIPYGVTTIYSGSFQNNQLTSIEIPSSVTSIYERAFAENQLTSVTISSGVTLIASQAFSNNQLTSVTIPASVLEMRDGAFSDNQLTSVTIYGKSSTSDFTSYGENVFGWAEGYSDANIIWVNE